MEVLKRTLEEHLFFLIIPLLPTNPILFIDLFDDLCIFSK